ncbi:hypothetical protein ABW20_dc0110087 [Dactylellina cionopaga]|nr:hypothetical protein ABW20_dc0110087 [Dactylellina cionopaga]
MPNKHYLHDSETSHSFPQKRHVSAPSRYTPVQAPHTPVYSPITQAASPISPSQDDMMIIDKPDHRLASPDDLYDNALLTPQETKRSTASPPAMFQSPTQSRPMNFDGLAQKFLSLDRGMDIDVDMEDDSDDDDLGLAGLDNPKALMAKYFNQTDLNPDVIVLKSTIEMLRKRRQQCLADIGSLSRMKDTALARPDRFAARVVAASRGAQKTSVHQGKHHWRLEENEWEVPGPQEIPRVPEFEWAKYGVPPMYKNPDVVAQAQAVQSLQYAQPSPTVQEMINPNSNRMTTRATNSARSAAAAKPTQQGFNIRTGLDMEDPNLTGHGKPHYPIPYLGTPDVAPIRNREEVLEFLRTFLSEETVRKAQKAVPPKPSKVIPKSSKSDREIISQSLEDSIDIYTPVSSEIRSVGKRHVSMPVKLGGNTSLLGSDRGVSEMESLDSFTFRRPMRPPRLAPASAFPSSWKTTLQRPDNESTKPGSLPLEGGPR